MTFRNLAYAVLLCGLSVAGCADGDKAISLADAGVSGAGMSNGGSGGNAGSGGSAGVGGHAGSGENAGTGGNAGNAQSGAGGMITSDAGLDAGLDAATVDAAPDATTDAGSIVHFTVPVNGGPVTFTLPGGIEATFDFPASAAGVDIVLAPSTDQAIGWPAGKFASVIQMQPDGFAFADPVRVSLADGSLILLNFASSPVQSAPDPLALAADGQALELTHFSSLAVVAPGQSCQSTSGWSDTANAQQCINAGGGKTSYRGYGCKNFAFCYVITAGCCVVPGTPADGCHIGDTNLTLLYTRTDSNGGQYPYCDLLTQDAGPDGGGATAVVPYLQSYLPQQLVAGDGAQVITLYGSNFEQNGAVFFNSDMALTTTWVSAGEAYATVPAQYLLSPGTLLNVGYVNPAQAGGYDWLNRSNMVSIPIVTLGGDAGAGIPDAGGGGLSDATAPITDAGGGGVSDATTPITDAGGGGVSDATTPITDAGGGGGVSDASSSPDASVPPVLLSYLPATVPSNQGDQVITLFGSGFDPNGTGFYSLDSQAVTTWINSGEIQMTVPVATLQQQAPGGFLTDVGYVNPAPGGGFDWPNRSNTEDIPIVDVTVDASDAGP